MRSDVPKYRQKSVARVGERTAVLLVSELRECLPHWHGILAYNRALSSTGREAACDLQALLVEMENARRRLLTELQAQGVYVRRSGPVTSVRRSLDRAIDEARNLIAAAKSGRNQTSLMNSAPWP